MKLLIRLLVLPILLLAGASIGWVGHAFLPEPLLVAGSKWLASGFGVVWAGMLWLMPKIEDLTDCSGLSYEQHRKLEFIIHHRMFLIKKVVLINAIAALLAFLPEGLSLAKVVIPIWVFPMVGAMLGFAAYGVWMFFKWREDVRAFRSHLKEQERLQAARDKMLEALKGKEGEAPLVDPKLDGFRSDATQNASLPGGGHPA